MKKKLLILFIFIILSFTILCSCNQKLKPTLDKMPWNNKNQYYYTTLLTKDLIENYKCKVTLLDTNFFKEKELKQEDITVIRNFIKQVKKENFLEKTVAAVKPAYKIYLNFDNKNKDKFLINVFDEQNVTIHLWDGTIKEDIISSADITKSANLYLLCNYIIENQQ